MSCAQRSVVPALVRYARSSSSRVSRTRPKPRASVAVTDVEVSQNSQPVPIDAHRDDWVEVRDSKSNNIYYWNKSTNETTAVGEPRPGPDGRHRQVAAQSTSLVGLLGMGAGVGLVFALISRIF